MSRRTAVALSAEVEQVLASWQPAGLDAEDMAAWAVVAPTVQVWVATAAPDTATAARNLLWAAARHTIYIWRTLGTLDPSVVWHPHNTAHFVMHVCADRSRRWRHCARSALQRVGRAVNPGGWRPAVKPEVGRAAAAAPYGPHDERLFALDAAMSQRPHRPACMWVVAGSLGAGLTGPELAAAGPHDLVELSGDALATHVRGRHRRLVPIRAAYTAMVREAAATAAGDRFIAGGVRNPHNVASRLNGEKPGLVLRRARSTWLAAHLVSGTPLAALRIIAGPVGAQTLDSLLAHVGTELSPQDAAMLGLGA